MGGPASSTGTAECTRVRSEPAATADADDDDEAVTALPVVTSAAPPCADDDTTAPAAADAAGEPCRALFRLDDNTAAGAVEERSDMLD